MRIDLRVGLLVALLQIAAGVAFGADTAATNSAPPIAPAETGVAADYASKEALIRRLMVVNGSQKLMEQMKSQMFAMFRQRASKVPPEYWDRLEKDMDTGTLIEESIPLYEKYYTTEDLKAQVAFFESPAGQHMVAAQKNILKESSRISQEWSQAAALKVMMEMQDRKRVMGESSTNSVKPSSP